MEIYGADISGIHGQLIKFRVVKETERRGVTLLGLAQKVVKEGYIRAAKAIETLEGNWDIFSNQGYTIDLSPAETPKTSAGLDLPIAIMLLQASILQDLDTLKNEISKLEKRLEKERVSNNQDKRKKIINNLESLIDQRDRVLKYKKRLSENKRKYLLIGTLDIASGEIIAPLYGMIGMIAAAQENFTVIVPEESEIHAALFLKANPNIKTIVAKDLQEVWNIILGISPAKNANFKSSQIVSKSNTRYVPNLNAIEGVAKAKLAIEVALAGGHNILLVGPPGQGKTMLSQASINLLPNLDHLEMFELNKIYSAMGALKEKEVVLRRPFVEVSNATQVALFGGGRIPKPGLISAAHKGILFFDEINMSNKIIIEELRKPLNDRVYTVQRSNAQSIEYPSNFLLVAAMNSCRCGWYQHYICSVCGTTYFGKNSNCENHPGLKLNHKCICTPSSIERFKNAISKPLLDRIDLKVFVSSYDHNTQSKYGYASRTIKANIEKARAIQIVRYKNNRFVDCNADVQDKSQFEELNPEIKSFIKEINKEYNISTKRKEVKLLLVSRTIADLDGEEFISKDHISKSINLMGLDHEYFSDLN